MLLKSTKTYLNSHLAAASPPAFLRCHLKMYVAVCPGKRVECVSSNSLKKKPLADWLKIVLLLNI